MQRPNLNDMPHFNLFNFGFTTLSEVNAAINRFKSNLKGEERSDYLGACNIKKTNAIGWYAIPGNMMQARGLLRYFPLIMSDMAVKYPHVVNDDTWKMIVMLSELVRGYSAFHMSESQVKNLETLYIENLDTRLRVDSRTELQLTGEGRQNSLIVKHATVLQYPKLVMELGPLAYYSTALHERKNGWLKAFSQRKRCYKNPLKSVSTFIERTECPSGIARVMSKAKVVSNAMVMGAVRANRLGHEVWELICDLEDAYALCYTADIGKMPHKVGMYVSFFGEEDRDCACVCWGKIIALLFDFSKDLKIVVQHCSANWVHEKQAFSMTLRNEYVLLSYLQLASHHPVKPISVKGFADIVVVPTYEPVRCIPSDRTV